MRATATVSTPSAVASQRSDAPGPPRGRRAGVQAGDHGHRRRSRTPRTRQSEHKAPDRRERVPVNRSKVDYTAGLTSGAIHVHPRHVSDNSRPGWSATTTHGGRLLVPHSSARPRGAPQRPPLLLRPASATLPVGREGAFGCPYEDANRSAGRSERVRTFTEGAGGFLGMMRAGLCMDTHNIAPAS
jgi:hypothetical protein